MAQCYRNSGSLKNGMAAQAHRTSGSFAPRLFNNGSFDIYLYGEYLETTNSLEEYGTFPIYDSKEKLTH